jgi:hypothetical protein
MIAVIAARKAESAFHYTLLLNQSGYQTLAVRETAPLLSCIQHPMSCLLLLEDGFTENTSAHALINLIRSTPGPKSSIPILRVWKGPILATGSEHGAIATVSAPVTGSVLEDALRRLGLGRAG